MGIIAGVTLALILLVGCQKPKIVKTVEVKYDTVRTTKFDTVREVLQGGEKVITVVRKDTFYITKTHIETVYEKCNDRTERIKAKFDYKTERDSLETILKLERENTKQKRDSGQQVVRINNSDNKKEIKQTRIENRSKWWLWLLIGLILGFFVHRNLITV